MLTSSNTVSRFKVNYFFRLFIHLCNIRPSFNAVVYSMGPFAVVVFDMFLVNCWKSVTRKQKVRQNDLYFVYEPVQYISYALFLVTSSC